MRGLLLCFQMGAASWRKRFRDAPERFHNGCVHQQGYYPRDVYKRQDLLGACTAGVEVPCKLVEVAAYLAALGKQGGNRGQGFFSAAGNDDRFLDFNVVDGTADKSGEGEIQEFASEFQ